MHPQVLAGPPLFEYKGNFENTGMFNKLSHGVGVCLRESISTIPKDKKYFIYFNTPTNFPVSQGEYPRRDGLFNNHSHYFPVTKLATVELFGYYRVGPVCTWEF